MKFTYFYSFREYGSGAFKPIRTVQEQLGLKLLMEKTNDPDYPINSRTDICLLDEDSGTVLNVSVYPERGWIPSYMSCEKVKAEMVIEVRNKDQNKVDKIKSTIDEIVRNSELEMK